MSTANYTAEYYANAILLELAYEAWLRDDAHIDWGGVAQSLIYFQMNPPEHDHLRCIVMRLGFIVSDTEMHRSE